MMKNAEDLKAHDVIDCGKYGTLTVACKPRIGRLYVRVMVYGSVGSVFGVAVRGVVYMKSETLEVL